MDMFFINEKNGRRIKELEQYRYRECIDLEKFAVSEDTSGLINPEVPREFDGWETMKVGDYWSGRDQYLWMHKDLEIPESWKGRKIVALLDAGRVSRANMGRFELMFYLNGSIYQGVDENHREVFLSDSLCGTTADVTLRLWSGVEESGPPTVQEFRLACAKLAWLDEKTDDLHYMASMVLKTVECLDEHNPVRTALRVALDESLKLIDWAYPGSGGFYESVYRADRMLNERIDSMGKHSDVTVWCVGHTHIDMAWLWRLKHTKGKGARSFATVLRLMELFPEYIFLQSQPQLYEYVKEEFPELYEQIKKRAAEGRWETDGVMWVEADCNLTGGESLTRQILLGSRFFREEFGHEPEFLWLPDVFGYSWALPQILKKAGIHTFMTIKISWSQYNRMPHDTFMWRGIDGSEVLTHFLTVPEEWNPEPGNEERVCHYTYSGNVLPGVVKGTWDAYRDKEINRDLLMAYGYGDGGGGVTRDMLENRRRIDRIPGLPSVKPLRAGEYFRKLHKNVENTERYVHTWDGELYLEYHRGTYTSHGYNKKMNRRMEMLYRRAEWMTVMGALAQGGSEEDGFTAEDAAGNSQAENMAEDVRRADGKLAKAEQEKLTKGWKLLLTNQFHDIIPGSSVHDVYEDSRKDYEEIERVAGEVQQDFYNAVLEKRENVWTAFNDSTWARTGLVRLPDTGAKAYRDGSGNVLRCQKEDDGIYVEVRDVPGMGYETVEAVGADIFGAVSADPVFEVYGWKIATPFYEISLNECGQITRLYDRSFDREVIPEGARANVFQMFEDKPLDFDAWDVDIFYQDKMREITELTKFEVSSEGSLQMKVHLEWKYMNSRIEQDMILYGSSRRIDFRTRVDFHERQQLLKAAFPVNIRSTYATYDVQYGNVRRPNNWNTSWDQAKFETVAHRWADLSERNYGVSILNDCKYGHDIKDNVMRITLIKSAIQPDYLQDQGMHVFTYSLLPHAGDFVEGRTVQEAFDVNEPMQAVPGKAVLPFRSFLTFDNDQVELDAVKKSEDGKYLVVRFHEYAGSRQKVTLRMGFEFASWAEGDLMERRIGEWSEEKEIRMEVGAYEIKTVLVEI